MQEIFTQKHSLHNSFKTANSPGLMDIVVIGCTLSTKRFMEEIVRHKDCRITSIFTLEDKYAVAKSRHVLLDDFCASHGIPLYKLDKISNPTIIQRVKELKPDIILESGWSQIIPFSILNIPRLGTIGVHCSFLPKNQGAASINWALIKDEKKWGVSLFYLTAKVDEGDIIEQRNFPINDRDDVNTLFDKADFLAVEMLHKNLPLLAKNTAPRIKQNKEDATYLPRRKPEDGKINWKSPSREIFNLVRALTKPYPGAFTSFKNTKILVWKAEQHAQKGKPGAILAIMKGKGILAGTGEGSILIIRAQTEQGVEVWADDLAPELHLKEGDTLGA